MSSAATERSRQLQIKRLEACLAKPENRECFDCTALRPRWASTNLGIFICMRCAGIHRALGTHLTKVKSINMDLWEEAMIRNCETIGNSQGKWLYEANIPVTYVKPGMNADNREVERQIRLKFESKVYYARPDQQPPASTNTAVATPSQQAQPALQQPAAPRPVVQAVPVATTPPAGGAQQPDLFGEFASTRNAAPQPKADDIFGPSTSAPKPNTGMDFFDGPSAGANKPPAPSNDFFGAPTPAPPKTNTDFFGAPSSSQPSSSSQGFFGAPAAAPPPSVSGVHSGAPTQQSQPDFFNSAPSTTGPMQPPTHGPFQSMMQQPQLSAMDSSAKAKGPLKSPNDPFKALASERPKTPPKLGLHQQPPVGTNSHHQQQPASKPPPASDFDLFGGGPTAGAPPAPPKKQQQDMMMDIFGS